MLAISMRCNESVHMECQVCFAAWFPALPVHATFPPSVVCERGLVSWTFLVHAITCFIFSFAYLR